MDEVTRLRAEFKTADPDRQDEITSRLNSLGQVVFPPGSPEYETYARNLRVALSDPDQLDALLFPHSH